MRSGLFVLPFLAILSAALGAVFKSSFANAEWFLLVGWGIAAILIALWILLDAKNFKQLVARRSSKYGASSSLTILLGAIIIIGVAVLSTKPRFNKSIDLTRDGLNTLSDQSYKLIKKLKETDKELEVTGYFIDDEMKQRFQNRMELYTSAGAKLKLSFIDPRTDPISTKAAKITLPNTVVIKNGDKVKQLTTLTEEKIANSLTQILKDKTKTIYFTSGHGEGSLDGTEATGFSAMNDFLKINQFKVKTLSLLEKLEIPNDADLLVIAGPIYDFKSEEIKLIDEYLKQGGSVLSLVDSMTDVQSLNNMLSDFGITYNSDLLLLSPDDPRASMLGQNTAIISKFDDFSPVTRDFSTQSAMALMLSNTRSISTLEENTNKMKVSLVAKSAETMVRVKGVNSPNDLQNLNSDRWETGEFAVMAVSVGKAAKSVSSSKNDDTNIDTNNPTKQKEPQIRLVSVGSSQFVRNIGSRTAEHRDMFMNIVNFLMKDEDFISIRPKDLTKSVLSLNSTSSQISLLFLAFIYPFIFLGGGTLVWLRRRNA